MGDSDASVRFSQARQVQGLKTSAGNQRLLGVPQRADDVAYLSGGDRFEPIESPQELAIRKEGGLSRVPVRIAP